MNDLQLDYTDFNLDLVSRSGNIITSKDLENAVLISLLTDKRATEAIDGYQGGWWGDVYSRLENESIGSLLWTLRREKATTETLNRAKEIIIDSLKWLLEDKIIEKLEVNVEYINREFLGLEIKLHRSTSNELFKYEYAWEAQKLKRSKS